MTRAAFLSELAVAIWTTPDVLRVRMAVVALARKVASRVTVQAARMFQHGNDRKKRGAGASVVALGQRIDQQHVDQ
ncbi:MAG TPA: hypothetical protein VJP89_01220 [Pyrinomonadaceae bacterium]|nr:hypothetical protein [Pyrinomonadaceae bacterium]